MIWLSSDLRFNCFGCHLIWGSNDLVVIWFESQLIWLPSDLRFKCFWLSIDLGFKWLWWSMGSRFKWFGCQVIWNSIDLVVNWFEIQWFGCQMVWDSSDLVVNWFEVQLIWLSGGVWFKWFWIRVELKYMMSWIANRSHKTGCMQKALLNAVHLTKIACYKRKCVHSISTKCWLKSHASCRGSFSCGSFAFCRGFQHATIKWLCIL